MIEFPLLLIRTEEWLAICLAAVGMALGLWFARDNWYDLREYRERGWNGFAELAAVMPIRSGISKAILHALLSVLPIISLTAVPPRNRYSAALIFFAAVSMGQIVVIVAQVLNQRDRMRLRRRLAAAEAST